MAGPRRELTVDGTDTVVLPGRDELVLSAQVVLDRMAVRRRS